jgi:putative tricarboxylic transport membrane protein
LEERRTDRISGLIVFFLGIAILWQGRSLSIGTLRAPGSGFFPMLLAVTLMILSLLLVIPRARKEAGQSSFSAQHLGRVSMLFVALLVYFAFLEYLGFVIMSFLLMAFCFIRVARQKWYTALFWAFVSIGLAYLLFDILLKSSLPRGVFGF